MKTIVDTATNTSKYLVADDYGINVTADNIEMGDPSALDFIIGDLNSSNATVIEGVTEPDDWYGCKYTCAAEAYVDSETEEEVAAGTFILVEGWVDPREEAE